MKVYEAINKLESLGIPINKSDINIQKYLKYVEDCKAKGMDDIMDFKDYTNIMQLINS